MAPFAPLPLGFFLISFLLLALLLPLSSSSSVVFFSSSSSANKAVEDEPSIDSTEKCKAALTAQALTGTYGKNYGRIADNLPSPKSVVTLLNAAKIKNIRIYNINHEVLMAFNGSGIEIVVGLGGEFLTEMSVNEDRSMSWIKENVQPFLPGTSIHGIAIRNENLASKDRQDLWEVLLPAAKNVYNALDRLDLTKVVQDFKYKAHICKVCSLIPSLHLRVLSRKTLGLARCRS